MATATTPVTSKSSYPAEAVGRLFAPPTYGYITIMVVFIGYGLVRTVFGDLGPLPVDQSALDGFTENGALRGA